MSESTMQQITSTKETSEEFNKEALSDIPEQSLQYSEEIFATEVPEHTDPTQTWSTLDTGGPSSCSF